MTMLGRRYFVAIFLVSLVFAGYGAGLAGAQSFLVDEGAGEPPLDLILPTRNDALFRGDGPAFYQYTDRRTKHGTTRPWQGGQYGFVRNVRETPYGSVFSRFHEGVDIIFLVINGDHERDERHGARPFGAGMIDADPLGAAHLPIRTFL